MDCDWDNPGHNVYTGSPQAAIMAFEDIPLDVRKTLIFRVQNHADEFTDVVTIRKASITGRNDYLPDIRQMHFGSAKKMCSAVSRIKWKDSDSQGAIVYCEQEYCIARPAVCNNWFRISRRPAETVVGPIASGIPEVANGIETGGLGSGTPMDIGAPAPYSQSIWSGQPITGDYGGSNYYETPSYGQPAVPVFLVPYGPIQQPVIAAVPEPSNWMIFIGGFILFYFWPRKKK